MHGVLLAVVEEKEKYFNEFRCILTEKLILNLILL